MTPRKTHQQIGRDFEAELAKTIGVEPQRSSGGLWYAKLDIDDNTLLWSLKHTGHRTMTLTPELFNEARRVIHGTGGRGGDMMPAMAFDLDGMQMGVMQLGNMISLLTGDSKYIPPSRPERQRRRASVPELLRDRDED